MERRDELKGKAREQERRQRPEAALELYLRLASDPTHPAPSALWARIGRLQHELGNRESAADSFSRAVEGFVQAKQINNAIAVSLDLLEADPDNAGAQLKLGQLAIAHGLPQYARAGIGEYARHAAMKNQTQDAIEPVAAFLERFPEERDLWREWVGQLLGLDREDEAVAVLNQLAQIVSAKGLSGTAQRLLAEIDTIKPGAGAPASSPSVPTSPSGREVPTAPSETASAPPAEHALPELPLLEVPVSPADVDDLQVARIEGLESTGAGWGDALVEDRESGPPGASRPLDLLAGASNEPAAEEGDEEHHPLPLLGADDFDVPGLERGAVSDAPADLLPELTRDSLRESLVEPLPELTGDARARPAEDSLPDLTTESLPELTGDTLPGLIGDDFPELTGDALPGLTGDTLAGLTTEMLPDLTADTPRDDISGQLADLEHEALPGLTDDVWPEAPEEAESDVVYDALPELGAGAGDTLPELELDSGRPTLDGEALGAEGTTPGDSAIRLQPIVSELRLIAAKEVERAEPGTHYDLGLAYKEMGLVDDSLANLRMAIERGHDPLAALEVVAEILVDRGDYDVVTRLLDDVPGVGSDSSPELLGIHYWQGRAAEEAQRSDTARRMFELVVGADPSFRDAAERLSRLRG